MLVSVILLSLASGALGRAEPGRLPLESPVDDQQAFQPLPDNSTVIHRCVC